MNWELFWPLLAISILVKWVSESPESWVERVIIAVIYTVACAFASWMSLHSPNNQTVMAFAIFAAPVSGDVMIKVYRHYSMKRTGRQYGPFPS